MNLTDDLAGRADAAVQSVGILHIERSAMLAAGEIKFVVVGNATQEIPRPFETKPRRFVQQQIRFIRSTQAMAKFNVRPGPTGMHEIVLVDTHEESCRKQCDKGCRLYSVLRILDETAYLARRLTAATFDVRSAAVTKVGRVKFAYTVIGKSRALSYCSGSCFVANHSQGEFELAALPGVSIIG